MRGSRTVLVLVAGAALLAGCGGGSDDAGGSPAVTKADFVTKANAVCRSSSVSARSVPTPSGPDDRQGLESALLAAADLGDQQVTNLRALKRPAADEAVLLAMFQGTSALAAQVRAAAAALKDGTTDPASVRAQLAVTTRALNRRYDDYGLGACGSNQ